MTSWKKWLLIILPLGLFPTAAYANQPPEPPMLLAELLILPIMIFCTALAGGYQLLEPQRKKSLRLGGGILVLVALLFSATHEGLGAFVAAIFGYLSLTRSFQLLTWGLDSWRGKLAEQHRSHARAYRLIPAGLLLMCATVGLTSLAMASIDTYDNSGAVERGLTDFILYQAAYADEMEENTGKRAYNPDPENINFYLRRFPGRFGSENILEVEFSEESKGYHLHYLRSTSMPFWPYNYYFKQSAYYADDTGKLRRVYVDSADERCPPDGPVVWSATPNAIEAARERL